MRSTIKWLAAMLASAIIAAGFAGTGRAQAGLGILEIIGLIDIGYTVVSTAAGIASDQPGIADIDIDGDSGNWHVGDVRSFTVTVDASFGAIDPTEPIIDDFGIKIGEYPADVATMTIQVLIADVVEGSKTFKFHRDAATSNIEYAPGRKVQVQYTFKIQARAVGANQLVKATVKVKGIKENLSTGYFEVSETVTDSETLGYITVDYPFEKQQGKTGRLYQPQYTLRHWDPVQKQDRANQALQIKNLSHTWGYVDGASVGNATKTGNVSFTSNYTTSLVTGTITHGGSAHPLVSQQFQTSWSMGKISLNLTGETWTTPSESGPTPGLSNTCDGVGDHLGLELPPVLIEPPEMGDLLAHLHLDGIHFQQPTGPAVGWSVQLINPVTGQPVWQGLTDDYGDLTIDQTGLPYVVQVLLNPPDGELELYHQRQFDNLTLDLLAAGATPHLDTVCVREKRGPVIQGNVESFEGLELNADLYAISSVTSETTYLGPIRGVFSVRDIGMVTLGNPTTLRIEACPGFNEAYLPAALEFNVSTADSVVDLGQIVFIPAPPSSGPVHFQGIYHVIGRALPNPIDPLPGLDIEVEGVGTATTDEEGFFVMSVPSGLRRVSFPNWKTLISPHGRQLDSIPDFEINFGRGGDTLSLGIVELTEMTATPGASRAGLALLVVLMAAGGVLFIRRARSSRA